MGLARAIGLIALTVLVLMFLTGLWWNRSPNLFDVQAAAQKRADRYNEKLVPGYITTNTLIEVANTLLNKSGGYSTNDIMPPSVFIDDMPSWEWGVLQQVRDFSKALRNDISRSSTQSEDPDFEHAGRPIEVEEKTPWMEVDNVFYEARGTCWALIHFLRAVEIDFKDLLKQKNTAMILQQVIIQLETTQKAVWSPLILNGSEFGLFANHSLVLSSYISRANTGIIELYNLLNH
ncbi:MAG: hypothetical protein B6247_26965 [Candidatus Parabeggiatoa sp. nov. 2]|nr:MAG: hypothetical protein B6247_26965 [Beggiatoa sp. 4572_84]